MNLQEHLERYLELNTDRFNTKYLYHRDPDLWKQVCDATAFLPSTAMPKQRCWHVQNQIWEIPLCQVDHVPRTWWENRYLTYSSLSAKNRCPIQLEKRTTTQRKNKEAKIGRSLDERETYRNDVWRHTKRNWSKYKTNIDKWELRSRAYHLDHIYSLDDGFKNRIDPAIIGHWANFRIISAEENLNKHMRSDISLAELLIRIQQFSPQ